MPWGRAGHGGTCVTCRESPRSLGLSLPMEVSPGGPRATWDLPYLDDTPPYQVIKMGSREESRVPPKSPGVSPAPQTQWGTQGDTGDTPQSPTCHGAAEPEEWTRWLLENPMNGAQVPVWVLPLKS